ncbi:MAG: SRPBCC domain-containing protein [Bacteroidetes bacterium]|nr:SRPBCC domain-containing protein [Bacteroidota bacterium]
MQKELVVSRVFNAPLEHVWRVWTDPDLIMRWWGPDKFTCPYANIDFREGGKSVVCMRAPKDFGGQDIYSVWEYRKIEPMKNIEFIQNLADKNGNKMQPVQLGMPPDFPEDLRTVVTFKQLAKDKIEMTVTEYADFGQMSHFAKLGLEQSMDKMVAIFS